MGDVTVLHQVPNTITLYKLDDGKFTSLGTTLGCAIVGSAVSLSYQLMCYGDGVPSTVTATISPTNTLEFSTAQGQSYASFTADDGNTYSIAFRNDSDAVNLSVHIGLAFYGSKARPADVVTTYDLVSGSGKSVDSNDTVGIVSTGWIVQYNEKNLPVTGNVYQQLGTADNVHKMKVGDVNINKGLSQGIRGMKKESKRVIVIPGAFQAAISSTLVYIVHVIKVKWDTSPPPAPPVASGISAQDFADFEAFRRMKEQVHGNLQSLPAPPGTVFPQPQPQQPQYQNQYQHQHQQNPYQQQQQPAYHTPYQPPQPQPQPPPQPVVQSIVQQVPVVQQVNVPVLTPAEIGAVQAALSEHAAQHQTAMQQLQMHFQQQHINFSASLDSVVARLSSTSTKIENLEGHRLFKENQGSMSGVAITASISKLVNDNDTFRAEINEKDEKIVELKGKVDAFRKKTEQYANESAGILEEKKSAVNQVSEVKAELDREIARLKETLQRAYSERDDAQRHAHTLKKLHDLSEEELRRTKQRLDGLDTSSQADSERINDLQQTIREEKTKNKELSSKSNALRDELAEEKEAHLRTQQQLDERRKKNEAERSHYNELIEQERKTAAEELRRVREEMKESSSVKERHWDEEKAHLQETTYERGRIEGMKAGRDEAQSVANVTIANMQTQLDNAAAEIAGLQERISSLQSSLDAKSRELVQTQEHAQAEKVELNAQMEAALEKARGIEAEAERVREQADKDIKDTLESSRQRVKAIMSTVYFKFHKAMREHRKEKGGPGIKRKEADERLLEIIKQQTLRALDTSASLDDDEEDDEEDESEEEEDWPAPAPATPAPVTPATASTVPPPPVVAPIQPVPLSTVAAEVQARAEPPVLVPATPATIVREDSSSSSDSDEDEGINDIPAASPTAPHAEPIITSTHVRPTFDEEEVQPATDTEQEEEEETKQPEAPAAHPLGAAEDKSDDEADVQQTPLTATEEAKQEAEEAPAAAPTAVEEEEPEPVSEPVVVEPPAPPKKKSYFDSDSEDEKEEPMSDPVVVEQPVPEPEPAPTPAAEKQEEEAEPVVVEQPTEEPEVAPPSPPPKAPSPPPAASKKGLFDSDDEEEEAPKPVSPAAAAAAAPAKKKGLFDSDDEDEDDGIMNAIGAKTEDKSKGLFDSDEEDMFT